MKLDPTLSAPFYRQIEAQLAESIRLGALAPHAALPSVRALAAELLVSVITVKQAYEALEAAGLVYSHQGRGTFVAPAGQQAAEAQARRQFAHALRAAAAEARARGVGEAELRALALEILEESCSRSA